MRAKGRRTGCKIGGGAETIAIRRLYGCRGIARRDAGTRCETDREEMFADGDFTKPDRSDLRRSEAVSGVNFQAVSEFGIVCSTIKQSFAIQ